MKLSKEAVFRQTVRSAFTAGAACSAVSLSLGSAIAQETPAAGGEATQLDAIEVTGTRIRRVELETANPVFVIDRAMIESSGVATLGQLLQEMPTIAGAATNPQVNNGGGSGAATVSLRGLGSERTLLLLNGRRLIDNDVNSIPINLVERVEILKDGASAIYGSDAVGGVVNFITRKNFQGTELVAGYGNSDRGDGDRTNWWATFGTPSQKGNLVIGLNFDDRGLVKSGERDFSKDPFALYYGQQIVLGSSRVPTGRYRVPGGAGGTFDCNGDGIFTQAVNLTRIATEDGRQVSDYRCFIAGGAGNDTYDFQDENVVVTPQERYGAFLQGGYKLGDSVEFFNETFYHNTNANYQIAPEPYDARPAFTNTPASAQSIYNPFGQTITDLRLRLVSVGNRVEAFDTDRFQTTFGLKGALSDLPMPVLNTFSWDTYVTLGTLKQTTENHGEIFVPAMANALGPSFIAADGTPTCGTPAAPISGCVPIDFFGVPDQAALADVAPFVHDRVGQSLLIYSGNLSGDVAQLPAGPLGLAFGVEWREEKFEYQPDFLRDTGRISGGSADPTKGDFNVKETYAEVSVPILASMPGVELLQLNVGLRYSDYNTFGDTTNGKYGLEYRPIKDLLLRATYADVFRAPTIGDLFNGLAQSADSFIDPCNGITEPVGTNPNHDAACDVARDGSYVQTDSQLPALVGGNPRLTAEEGNTFTLGFVYNPTWFDPLSVEVDYWTFDLDNAIGAVGANNRLRACFNSGLLCDTISRDGFSTGGTGEIFEVRDISTNLGNVTTKGVDMGFKLNFGETGFGRIFYGLDATYLIEYDNLQVAGAPSTLLVSAGRFIDTASGGDGHFARWRALSNLVWKMGDFSAALSNRYIHHVQEGNPETGIDGGTSSYNFFNGTFFTCPEVNQQTAPAPTAPVVCQRNIESQLINDINLSYFFRPANTELTIGVDNFTDKLAPIIYSGFNGTTDVRTYDGVGRFFWARIKYSFQ